MDIGADAADQMLRTGIQITEAAVRLAALGAKNLAALLFALASNPKSKGATTMRRLAKSNQPLTVIPIPRKALFPFSREARRYGVLFAAVRGRNAAKDTVDIVAPANMAAQINHTLENIGYPRDGLEEEVPVPSRRKGLFSGLRTGSIRGNPAAERLEEMGAENLAALVLAMSDDSKQGREQVKQLSALLANKEGVKVYPLPSESAAAVKRQADIFEVTSVSIRARDKDAPYTLIVRAEDQEKMDTILQNLDVTPIAKPEPTAKNNLSREASERESAGRGIGSVERKADRPSIKPKVAAAKNRAAAMRAATQRMRPAPAAERG